jgi:hypothetical protein
VYSLLGFLSNKAGVCINMVYLMFPTQKKKGGSDLDVFLGVCKTHLHILHSGLCMNSFDDDFGQKIDLTVKIREILRNYPEGTSILKEIIQNSDDAGASKVIFCLDRRVHGTEGLAYAKIDVFQGAALVAYNNAIFREQDFISIQRIGDSIKKTGNNQVHKIVLS